MRLSIRSKLLFSYTTLIVIAFMIMIFLINKNIFKSNENIVLRDLNRYNKDVIICVQQYYLLDKGQEPEKEFQQQASGLLAELNTNMLSDGVIYSPNGKSKVVSEHHNNSYFNKTGSTKPPPGKESTVTLAFDNENVIATFSIPILYKDEISGIYQFSKDYSDLYKSSYSLVKTIGILAVAVVLGIIAVSLLISYNILQPLFKLRNYSILLANGDFNAQADINSKDELGDLAEQLSIMKRQLHTQMLELQTEHDKLKQLEDYRKQFFDNVTHELKTPITIISGFAQMIEETGFSDKAVLSSGISHIRKESERLHRMVVKLLDASRLTSVAYYGIHGDVNISELLFAVCKDLEIKAIRRDMTFKTNIPEGIHISGNMEDLRSAFANLLDNAIKYGGSSTSIEVALLLKGDQVIISVRDYGLGIPENIRKKIFEPFFKGMAAGVKTVESSGLGLFIVKKIIDNHSGTIYIKSIEQQGTTIEIQLPANL